MNLALFNKVKEQILAEPKLVNMDSFCSTKIVKGKECGTTGCIAGWAMIVMGMKKSLLAYVKDPGEEEPYVPEDKVATALLDISKLEASHLFYFHSKFSDEDVDSPYYALSEELSHFKPGSVKYAKVVAKAIDLCIDRHDTLDAFYD